MLVLHFSNTSLATLFMEIISAVFFALIFCAVLADTLFKSSSRGRLRLVVPAKHLPLVPSLHLLHPFPLAEAPFLYLARE